MGTALPLHTLPFAHSPIGVYLTPRIAFEKLFLTAFYPDISWKNDQAESIKDHF